MFRWNPFSRNRPSIEGSKIQRFNEPGLHKFSDDNNDNPKADVIFVHGLKGRALSTWHPGNGCNEECFPFWLGKEFKEKVNIWSFGYEAEPSKWFGSGRSMPIYDRALNFRERLVNKKLGQRPLIFITHSLGGLIVKKMLLISPGDEKKAAILEQTKGVVFLGTPHTGSNLAIYLNNLVQYFGLPGQLVARPNKILKELESNATYLHELNDEFTNKFYDLKIKAKVFFEKYPVPKVGIVVPENSGKLNIPGVQNLPADADHISIARPKDQEDVVYEGVRDFLEECLSDASQAEQQKEPEIISNP